jgi:hypothetical protein
MWGGYEELHIVYGYINMQVLCFKALNLTRQCWPQFYNNWHIAGSILVFSPELECMLTNNIA